MEETEAWGGLSISREMCGGSNRAGGSRCLQLHFKTHMVLCAFSTPTQRHKFEIQPRKCMENFICLPCSTWTADSPTFWRVQSSRPPSMLGIVMNKHIVRNSQHMSIHIHRCRQHDLHIYSKKGGRGGISVTESSKRTLILFARLPYG